MEFTQITPFVLCSDLKAQIAFYEKKLGFSCTFTADNYAFLRRDQVAVRLLECPPNSNGTPLGADQSFYIDVQDIDAIYQALEPELNQLPKDRVRAPFNQLYNQREFHVADEDGALVFFGQSIPET